MRARWVLLTGLVVLITGLIGAGIPTRDAAAQATATYGPSIHPEYETLLDEVIQALRPNETCLLPCFWGLTLGESNSEDLRMFVDANFEHQEEFLRNLEFEYYSPTDDNVGYQVIAIPIEDVGSLNLYAVKYIDTDKLFFVLINALESQNWLPSDNQVEIDDVLTAIGEPSEIFLELVIYPSTELNWFKMRLIYRDLGILIDYDIRFDDQELPFGESPMRFCTSHSHVIELTVMLVAPEIEQPFEPFISSLLIFNGDYPSVTNNMWALENMTDIAIPEFTRFFIENPEGCIEGISFNEFLKMHPEE